MRGRTLATHEWTGACPIVGIYGIDGTKYASYVYDAFGNHTALYSNGGATITAVVNNPFRYRGYYYDIDLNLYYLGSRYYDSYTGRFISADSYVSTGQGFTGYNMYAYCGNNPVSRADYNGQWWIFANAFIGFLVGAATKIVTNVLTREDWNDGIIGAAIGGATYGVVLATTGNIYAAGYASAAAESLTNEVLSYIPILAKSNGESNTKKITKESVDKSLQTIIKDTAINGTISAVTGKIASKILPISNGRFKPRKFISSFAGKYAIKAHSQTVIQGGLTIGIWCFHYQGMQSIPVWR